MLIALARRRLRNWRASDWSISPFVDDSNSRKESSEGEEEGEDEFESENETLITNDFRSKLKVKTVDEVPWIDLVRSTIHY